MKTLAEELRPPGHGRRRALPPEHLQPAVRRRRRRPLRGRLRLRAVPALRGGRRGDGPRGLPRVDGGDRQRAERAGHGRVDQRHASRSTGCWRPGPSSTATRSPRPPTASTDWTADGLIEPVDWTTAHTPFTDDTRPDDAGDECAAVVKVVDGEFETVAPPDDAVAVLPARQGVGGTREHQLRLTRGAPAHDAAGDLGHRGHLPGDPPGDALGHRLRARSRSGSSSPTRRPASSTSPSVPRRTSRRRCSSRPGRRGAGTSSRPSSCRCSCWLRWSGCCSSGWSSATSAPARRSPSWSSPSGSRSRCPRCSTSSSTSRPWPASTPTGIVPDGATVFYDPFGVYRFSRDELVAMVVAVSAMAVLAAPVPVHVDRPPDASGGREPADDRAERDLRRPGVGLQLGAVEPVRGAGGRAHRADVQHARGRRTSSTSS